MHRRPNAAATSAKLLTEDETKHVHNKGLCIIRENPPASGKDHPGLLGLHKTHCRAIRATCWCRMSDICQLNPRRPHLRYMKSEDLSANLSAPA